MGAERGGPVRVLHVDDEVAFAELAAEYLDREGGHFEVTIESSAADALDAIREQPPDCVVSDHDMPGTTGLELLRTVRAAHPELPFVLFTGKGSEEIASEAISAGVTDYIQKGGGSEQFELLANRIENAVDGHRMREAFELEHEKLTELFRNSPDAVVEYRLEGEEAVVEAVNPAFEETFGRDADAVVGEALDEIVAPPEHRAEARELNRRAGDEGAFRTEVRRLAADGRRDFLLTSIPLSMTDAGYAVYTDVTAARERERRLSTLVSNLPGIVYRCRNEPDWPMEYVGGDCAELTGYEAGELEADDVVWGEDVLHPDDHGRLWERVQAALDAGEPFEVTYRIVTRGGETRWCWEQGRGVRADEGDLLGLEGFITDVTDYRSMQLALEATEDVLADLDAPAAATGLERVRQALDDVRLAFDGGGLHAGGQEVDGHDAGGHEAGGQEADGHDAGGHEADGHDAGDLDPDGEGGRSR